ncbi:uncharacterized protein LOC119996969 [Tripterygium wilfordii]|uniref:uncharacterized protein LOC119996969 n=1 Tax=Tripterygium wilfordii TaxID=458696 RepID=UPI0018F80113|nr:uncharacterized protein LOC119996969 [Tripterygium wilfordii]
MYKTEDTDIKKFMVGRFLDFKMVDSKYVITQVKDFQLILHEIQIERMTLSEEDNRGSEKRINIDSIEAKANMVKLNKSNKRKKSGASPSKNTKDGNAAIGKKKFDGTCFIYNKPGHRAKDCHLEVNLAEKPKQWWIDTGATCHIYFDRKSFTDYVESEEGEKLFMGNSLVCKVRGHRKVILKMTSGKKLTLPNVVHAVGIRKTLVIGSMLTKNGFKLVFESPT